MVSGSRRLPYISNNTFRLMPMSPDLRPPQTFAGQILLADELALRLTLSVLVGVVPQFSDLFLAGVDRLLEGDLPTHTRAALQGVRELVVFEAQG